MGALKVRNVSLAGDVNRTPCDSWDMHVPKTHINKNKYDVTIRFAIFGVCDSCLSHNPRKLSARFPFVFHPETTLSPCSGSPSTSHWLMN